jgi:hypothetical protein
MGRWPPPCAGPTPKRGSASGSLRSPPEGSCAAVLSLTYATEWIARRHLANLARRRRHLSRMLGTEVGTVDRTTAELGEAIEQFLHLEARGWKGRTGTALLVPTWA